MKKPLLGLSLAALLVTLDASTALAANKVWAGTASGNWSVPGNWVGAVPPQAGDDLTFPPPAGTLKTKTANDLPAGTPYNSLTLDGDYGIAGNGFQLNAVSPAVALTVAPGKKPVISTGAIFMHTSNANATSKISLGAGSLLDMHGTPQLTVGDTPPGVTNLVVSGGPGSEFKAPATLDFDTFQLSGPVTLVPQLLSQNGNTPGSFLTDPGTLIATAPNAGATIASSATMVINGDLLEAVSAPSTGGLDFQGPVSFGSSAKVSWQPLNSNVDNVINFNQGVDLSPAKFQIVLPPGFKPYAPNAVYPVITSQGAPFIEFGNMKEGETQTVGGYTFTAQYNVPDPGDFRVVVTGSPSGTAGLPAPPSTGTPRSAPAGTPLPLGVLLGLAVLLLAVSTASLRHRQS